MFFEYKSRIPPHPDLRENVQTAAGSGSLTSSVGTSYAYDAVGRLAATTLTADNTESLITCDRPRPGSAGWS